MMNIICLFRGHKLKSFWQKWEQFVVRGEKIGQSGIRVIYCERCGKFKSNITGEFIGV